MGSGCCKHCQDLSPAIHIRKLSFGKRHVCGAKEKSVTANGAAKEVGPAVMEEVVKPVKKEVTFTDIVDEAPVPPPRSHKKRQSKSLDADDDGTSTPDSQKSEDSLSDLEVSKSRFLELLRRDTFCDALDFQKFPLSRFPGRRASSLENLEDDDEGNENRSRSVEHLSEQEPSLAQSIAESKKQWLKDILQSREGKSEEEEEEEENNNKSKEGIKFQITPDEITQQMGQMRAVEEKEEYPVVYSSPKPQQSSRKSSMSESLKEFESSIYDMLKSKDKTESDDEEQKSETKARV